MAGDTTLLQRQWFEPLLKPGWEVLVQPKQKYGRYRDQAPEWLPPRTVNVLPSDFTTTIAAMTSTTTDTKNRKITEIDMPSKTLAQYKIFPLDKMIAFKVT
jgi:hypothetical protein